MKTFRKWVLVIGSMVFMTGLVLGQNSESRDKEKRNREQPPAKHPTVIKHLERIIGKWDLVAVYDGNKEISANDTVAAEQQQIEFTLENKYIRYTNNEQIDSGVFTMNENHSLVYLESKTGGETTSWVITLNEENNSMVMQQPQSSAAHGKQFRFVYRKQEE